MTCTNFECNGVGRERKVFDFEGQVADTRNSARNDSRIGRIHTASGSFEDHINRILQEQEKFMGQQQDMLKAHLQSFVTEQAELRSVMEKHHQQVMRLFESRSIVGNSIQTSDHAALLANEVPPAAPQIALPGSGCCKDDKELTSKVSERRPIEALDLSTLPHDWPHVAHGPSTHLNLDERESLFRRARRLVRGPVFDMVMCGVIIVNVAFMLVQIQWRGYYLGMLLGQESHDHGWQEHKASFEHAEFAFCTVYFIEFLVRIYLLRRSYFHSWMNIFDGFIVLLTAVQTYVMQPLGVMGDDSRFTVARLLRLVRVARILKVVRFAQSCSDLRVMLRTLLSSARSLAWSMLLMSGIILISGILLFQFLHSYMENESNPRETRLWVYDTFGGSLSATMVMFEATFSTAWVAYSRRLITEVNPFLSIFWGIYVVMVNFAVMRVISALFLKETMSVAAVDAEKMAMSRMKEKKFIADEIKAIFAEADESGDGTISVTEFMKMIYNPVVGECFEKLNLDVLEVATLFQMLVSDDGVADYQEFLEGTLKLKNSARTIDIIQILHEHMKLMKAVEDLSISVEKISAATGAQPLVKVDESG